MIRFRILILLGAAIAVFFVFLLHKKSRLDSLDSIHSELNSLISAKSIERQMSSLASVPHRAGSESNRKVGDEILRRLQDAGLATETFEYEVDLPEPLESRLFLTYPEAEELRLKEKQLPDDQYSRVAESEIPFFAYVPDFDMEAEVIYANFGEKKDYDYLKQNGVTVSGKIALVRAQGICRSMKALIAEEEGLAGLLLYPELRDQGFRKPAYPDGPDLNPWVVQRGSMLKFFEFPADPQEQSISRVPALPVTPEIAEIILNRLHGPSSPAPWKGWLSAPYNCGAGPARLRMVHRATTKKRTIRNIFATLRSTNRLDETILATSHYDAWVYGASDPSSGVAVMLEAARALSHLAKKGWQPRRDITFAFWDAEEYGMFGSTRWVQENLTNVQKSVIAMVYVDSIRGALFGSNILPGLRRPLEEILAKLPDPATGKPISELHAQPEMPAFSSDTIPFTNLAGVPVAQFTYGTSYPMYHSIYDDLQWMSKFGDPGYRNSESMAKIVALYLSELARPKVLPYQFDELGAEMRQVVTKLQLEHSHTAQDTNFNGLLESLRKFEESSMSLKAAIENNQQISDAEVEKINPILLQAIQTFLVTESPSPRNVLVGPSAENRCAGFALPGLQNSFLPESAFDTQPEIDRLIQAFDRARNLLAQAQQAMHR